MQKGSVARMSAATCGTADPDIASTTVRPMAHLDDSETTKTRVSLRSPGLQTKTAGFRPPLNYQLSKKLRSFRDRDGCFSLRSAFASI
jgi:hypothetical protein